MPTQFGVEEQDRKDESARLETQRQEERDRGARTKDEDEARARAESTQAEAARVKDAPPLDRMSAVEARLSALEARFSAPGVPLGLDSQGRVLNPGHDAFGRGRVLNPGHDAFGRPLKPGDAGFITP